MANIGQDAYNDASKAWNAGMPTFVYEMKRPSGRGSGPIDEWPIQLDAITKVGWKFHSWNMWSNPGGSAGVFLFTR
jgi:hypothetical protein